MKQIWSLAAAGAISRSFLGRVPNLAAQLGPVSSTSYRLAARISNTLRAGNAVRDFAEIQKAHVVLLCVPGGQVSRVIQMDAINWKNKIVLICDSPDDGSLHTSLGKRGAAIGSIHQISNLTDGYFIVGDRAAVRFAKLIAESLRGTAIEIPRDRLLFFQSALTLSGSFFTPLLETAVECLRQSGMQQPEAAKLAESLFQHSLRTFKRAGRKSWAGPIALADDHALAAQEQSLRTAKPLMASYFRDATRFSFDLFQTFPELTRYNKTRWKEFRKRYKQSS